jgi:hypothetical protein
VIKDGPKLKDLEEDESWSSHLGRPYIQMGQQGPEFSDLVLRCGMGMWRVLTYVNKGIHESDLRSMGKGISLLWATCWDTRWWKDFLSPDGPGSHSGEGQWCHFHMVLSTHCFTLSLLT